MAGVSTDLELTIDAALSAVDDLDAALTRVGDSFGMSLQSAIDTLTAEPVPLDADTTQFSVGVDDAIAGLDSTVDVGVTADVADAQTAVDSLDGGSIDILVTADTTEAQAAVDDLGAASGSATGSVDGLSTAASGLQGASGLAAGEVGGLSGAAASLGPEAAAVAGGVAAFGGTLMMLTNNAIEGKGATDRFKVTLGEFADQANNVKVGNMTLTLSELAQKVGSTDDSLINANATMFQFQTNAGYSGEQAAQFASNVSVLAARAVAMRPSLGDVGDVAQGMSTKFGRAAFLSRQYGLALNQTEIDNRAAALAMSVGRTEVTAQDKAMAGAQIAAERYTDAQQKIAEGAKNPIIQQRKLNSSFQESLETLGKPLISPMLDLIKQAMPAGLAFAKVFAQLGVAVLPALVPVLKALTPPLTLFGDLIAELSPILTPLIEISMFLVNPLAQLGLLFDLLGVSVKDVEKFFADLWVTLGGNDIEEFFANFDPEAALDDALNFLEGLPETLLGFGQDAMLGFADGLNAGLESVVTFFTDIGNTVADAVTDAATWLLQAGVDVITGFVDGIVSAVPQIASFLLGLPGQILGFIGDVAGLLVTKGVDLLTGLATGYLSFVGNVAGFFLGLGGQVLAWIGDTASTLVSKGAGFIQGIVGGIAGAVGWLIGTVAGLPGQALGGIGDVVGKFLSVGRDIVTGIVNGVVNGAQRIIDAVSNAVEDAWDEAVDFLGIGSPSRLFRDTIGLPIAQGIAVGIDAGATDISASLAAAVPSMVTGTSFGTITGTVRPLAAATAAPATTPDGIAQNALAARLAAAEQAGMSIHVEGVTDPMLAATLVAREQAFQQRYAGVR